GGRVPRGDGDAPSDMFPPGLPASRALIYPFPRWASDMPEIAKLRSLTGITARLRFDSALSQAFDFRGPMVDRKHNPRDRNIWKSPGGALFFKLGIPPDLRDKFLSSTGKPKTKISEPFGTDSRTEARVLRDQKLATYQRVFTRMKAGEMMTPEETRAEDAYRRERAWIAHRQAQLDAPPAPAELAERQKAEDRQIQMTVGRDIE